MGKVKQALEEDMMLKPENYNNPDPLKEDMVSEMDDFLKKHIIIGKIPKKVDADEIQSIEIDNKKDTLWVTD